MMVLPILQENKCNQKDPNKCNKLFLQIVFFKVQWQFNGKRKSSKQMMLEKLDMHMQKKTQIMSHTIK